MQEVSDAWYGYRNTSRSATTRRATTGSTSTALLPGTIELRYFNGTLHAGEVKAYVQLALAMAAKALSSKAASSKRREFNPATAKYDFRVGCTRAHRRRVQTARPHSRSSRARRPGRASAATAAGRERPGEQEVGDA